MMIRSNTQNSDMNFHGFMNLIYYKLIYTKSMSIQSVI